MYVYVCMYVGMYVCKYIYGGRLAKQFCNEMFCKGLYSRASGAKPPSRVQGQNTWWGVKGAEVPINF